MIAPASLNQRTNERQLAPFASWDLGRAPAGYIKLPIGAEAVTFYREQGYLVVEDALSNAEIDALDDEAARICRGDRGAIRGVLPAAAGEPDVDVMRRYLCIHFPHKVSPLMYRMLAHPAIVEVLTSIIGP